MKLKFYKIEELIRTVHGNNLYTGVTVNGDDDWEEYPIEAYASKVEAMAALTCNSNFKTRITVYTNDNSYGVVEYAVAEFEIETECLDPECGIDLKNCTPQDIVELSSCNCFDTLDGEDLVDYCVFTPMNFIVEIENEFNNEVLDYVLFNSLAKAENFAEAITLENIPAYNYYYDGDARIVATAMIYKNPNDLYKNVKVWDSLDEYIKAKELTGRGFDEQRN